MRVFIALPISEKLQDDVLDWEKNFLESFPGMRGQVRWLAGKNLHITIIPPWYENDVGGLSKKLASLRGKFNSFEIEFLKVAYGPSSSGRNRRLIWAEGRAPEETLEIKSGLESFLGKSPEERPFKTHLTLARFRPETFSSFPVKNLDEDVFWRNKIDSFVLMESKLSPSGSDYEILEKIPLRPLQK